MRMKIYIRILCLSLILPALSACSSPTVEFASHVVKKALPGPTTTASEGTFKVGSPYKIKGKWYYPQESYTLVETGIASWYGPGFHGKLTANGEIFDKNELTAAHRTLQMPSLVRVTNLENGRSLIVRINDRGPFARGRIIDLSERAAELLGFKVQGTAKVRVEVLNAESLKIAEAAKRGQDTSGFEVAMNRGEPIPANATIEDPAPVERTVPGHMARGVFYPDPIVSERPVTPTSLFIQAGSFSSAENANQLARRLAPFGQADVFPAQVGGTTYYRVRIGPLAKVAEADELLARMAQSGYKEGIIIVD